MLQTLACGSPTTVADLFAIVSDSLNLIVEDIRHGSSDAYRAFWNQESQWKVSDPVPEEVCRDRLKERLTIELRQLGISVERESDVADHRRADLRVLRGEHALPIECKRQDHRSLWTAIPRQLIEKYTRDPGSGGFGIYCVFWFGADTLGVASPPRPVRKPTTPADLQDALKATIPDGHEHLIKVVCIDVSRRTNN